VKDQDSRTCDDNARGGKVKSVHEAKAKLKIDFEDGSSATLSLTDPGSSIAVRDKNNGVEYLGWSAPSRQPRQSFPDAARGIRVPVCGASAIVNVAAALEFWKGE
jgi:hypothetical protein